MIMFLTGSVRCCDICQQVLYTEALNEPLRVFRESVLNAVKDLRTVVLADLLGHCVSRNRMSCKVVKKSMRFIAMCDFFIQLLARFVVPVVYLKTSTSKQPHLVATLITPSASLHYSFYY